MSRVVFPTTPCLRHCEMHTGSRINIEVSRVSEAQVFESSLPQGGTLGPESSSANLLTALSFLLLSS